MPGHGLHYDCKVSCVSTVKGGGETRDMSGNAGNSVIKMSYSRAKSYHRMSLDSGMIVVIMISMMYMVLVFGLLFYVKNDWCDLLFKNFTVIFIHTKKDYQNDK